MIKKMSPFQNKILIAITCSLTCIITNVHSQIQEGKIIFERKTNLFKKYTNKGTQDYIGESNKYKTEQFNLYFTETASVFEAEESYDNKLSWATTQNVVFQDFLNNVSKVKYSFYGAPIYVKDSIATRTWTITENVRTICNYECLQAVYEVDDSTRIYAWFTAAITPNVGPETYCNLPGAILGLAMEDGSVTYFAKSVDEQKIDLELYIPKFNEKKAKTRKELIDSVKKDFKSEKSIDEYIKDVMIW